MTRKEEIVQKAQKLAKRAKPLAEHFPMSAIISACVDMSEWTINSLWHDASELPDNPDTIIIEHSEYGTSVCLACTMSRVKGAVWCYLDDILPDESRIK